MNEVIPLRSRGFDDGAHAIAIIPARGGSKGLPRKNVMPLHGKPLLAHTISAARLARHIDRVIVSTDDPEIAAVARAHGAEVVDRPAALAGDLASSEAAILHAIDTLFPASDAAPEITVFLQCTSPLTASEDIDGLVEALIAQGADSAFTGTRFHHFLWRVDEAGAMAGINHDPAVRLMRQQRSAEFLETGAGYAMRTAGFRVSGHRFFGRLAMWETPAERVGEIDDLADFQAIEARMGTAAAAKKQASLPERPSALILDFDGVLTDDRVFVDEHGVESVVCSRSDGMGIEMLRASGLPMIVLSKEQNPVVEARCRKLQIACVRGLETKLATMLDWARTHDIDLDRAVYVGNDINDLECMARVGCAAAPRDARPRALAAADFIIDADGGRGAIRSLSELLLGRIQASKTLQNNQAEMA